MSDGKVEFSWLVLKGGLILNSDILCFGVKTSEQGAFLHSCWTHLLTQLLYECMSNLKEYNDDLLQISSYVLLNMIYNCEMIASTLSI